MQAEGVVGPGHMPIVVSAGEVLWDSQAKPGWSTQTKKCAVFVISSRVLSKGRTGRPWEMDEAVDCKNHWKVISGTYMYL